ncbi:ChbG/HpnK family deacetylase [Roseiarcaceae bacterium H3SJ34-1]|uniref:ChbG/HpnK family deacetylase n=1 Tax=Terripilifer ovatus TaxID=3032367 RepID=UPI003AB99B88|nr:ChbG/HpnK family deacetylase [Roseiarcaceae bacterium H3SJ34-1]
MAASEFILCADDYGLSPAVSRGILEALAAGRLSATGAMTNRPDWPRAARELAAFAGKNWLGVHLNLTLGAPLSAMPGFAPGGALPAIGRIARARAADLPGHEIAAEIACQLDAFSQAMGRAPDFVDGHQHVQALAAVRPHLFEELSRLDLPASFWLRDSSDTLPRIQRRRVQMLKAATVAWLGRGFAAEARAKGFSVNDGFAGFSSFDAQKDYGRAFDRYLVAAGNRHLVMCHPGHVDAELQAVDPVLETREQELAFFLSDRFKSLLSQRNAALALPQRQQP